MREIKKSFWDFVVVSGSTVLVIPLMLVSEVIQARYLGVTNYGKVTLFYSAISLLFLVSISWLRMSLVRFGKEEMISEGHLRKSTSSYFILAFFSMAVGLVPFYLFREWILNFLEVKHPNALLIIVVGVFIQILKTYVLETLKAIRLIKLETLLERLGIKLVIAFAVLFPVVFAFDWISVEYLIGVFLIADLSIVLVGLFFVKRKYIVPIEINWQQLRLILLFSIPLFFGAWSSYVVNYIDTYTINYYLTMEDVGIYSAAYKIFLTLKNFVGGITAISIPLIIALKTEGKQEIMSKYIKRIVPQGTFFAFLLVTIIIVAADGIFALMYGNEFAASVVPFKILSSTLTFTMLSSLITGFFFAFDMTKTISILGVFWGVFNVVADLILVRYFNIIGPAIASFFIFSLGPVVLLIIISRKFDVKRYLSLFYGGLTVFVLVVNLLPIDYWMRMVLSIAIVVFAVLFSRRFNLFRKDDIEMFNNVSLPNAVRRILVKILSIMSIR